ncbi:hypothetical protein [Catenuloplanes atrovinosus]|uniref:DUF2786 domain-containing protein n=1 Tax=Catenuloplanes atrovinosus TaxID=137266 RepID=A0AAE3YTK6_9ACTN|nr:hypothetical protein [Catenuloplanes atrovinosus]MDR7277641.1 hypothetical protein [Catenuloplanes atrovinosus]
MSKYSAAKWEATITALLAMSEDPALTDEHRQECAAKAAQLMTRHGLTAAQQHTTPESADLWPYAVDGADHFGAARARAAAAIATAMGCRAAVQTNPTPAPCMVAIVGVPADLDALRTLLPPVMRQANLAAASAAARGNRDPRYLAGFLTGYGTAVAERITTRRSKTTEEMPGAAVVLAARATAVDDLYAARITPHSRAVRVAADDPAGRAAGYTAGRTADLGDARIDTTD